jgi:hypothetical protein
LILNLQVKTLQADKCFVSCILNLNLARIGIPNDQNIEIDAMPKIDSNSSFSTSEAAGAVFADCESRVMSLVWAGH